MTHDWFSSMYVNVIPMLLFLLNLSLINQLIPSKQCNRNLLSASNIFKKLSEEYLHRLGKFFDEILRSCQFICELSVVKYYILYSVAFSLSSLITARHDSYCNLINNHNALQLCD